MGSGGTALGIIGIILAAGAIGFAFFVWNGQNATNSDLKADLDDLTEELNDLESDFSNLTRTIVVGIWDDLDENQDYASYNTGNNWLFEFRANNLSNTDYISVSNTNTRITLLKSGWYQIHISTILGGMAPDTQYSITILKNGAIEFYLDFIDTTSSGGGWYYHIDSSVFVYSNGTNYIEFNGKSLDDFYALEVPTYNQLTIEYVFV